MRIKILVCGDRDWTDRKTIRALLKAFKRRWPNCTIILIHGDCPTGADKIANDIGEALGFKIKRYAADWKQFHKAAGPIRNAEMIERNPDIELALAFHNRLKKSKGTLDMVFKLNEARIPVTIISSKSGMVTASGRLNAKQKNANKTAKFAPLPKSWKTAKRPA